MHNGNSNTPATPSDPQPAGYVTTRGQTAAVPPTTCRRIPTPPAILLTSILHQPNSGKISNGKTTHKMITDTTSMDNNEHGQQRVRTTTSTGDNEERANAIKCNSERVNILTNADKSNNSTANEYHENTNTTPAPTTATNGRTPARTRTSQTTNTPAQRRHNAN